MIITPEILIQRLLENEGGYVNNPKDPGGETKYGISKRSYPDLDIKNLTVEHAIGIYFNEYLDHIPYAQMHPAVAWQLLDFGVNSGMRTAVKALQRFLGVKADGLIGPRTLSAMSELDVSLVVIGVLSERIKLLMSLSTWDTFKNGWSNRITKCWIESVSDLECEWESIGA
jgi:lysozyme family protein